MGRLFGTNGVRGVANKELTPHLALDVALAIGTFLGEEKLVVVGNDTRISGDAIKSAVISGLMATGHKVLDIGVIPTPGLQYFVKKHDEVFAGVMITASHNPPEYNGIKLIWTDGTEAPREVEEKVEEIYFNRRFKLVEWEKMGSVLHYPGASQEYVKGVLSVVDVDAIKEREFHVIADVGNGAAYKTTPELLTRLNANVITLNAQPDGRFPARMPEPTYENIAYLSDIVKELGADFAVAHDGDADRAIFFDEKGRFIGGEYLLAMLAKYTIENTGRKIVVTPVSSGRVVEDAVKSAGGEIVYTKVGSPVVARKMIELGDKVAIGGEENGGIIYPPHQYCRDGAMAIALVMEMLSKTGKKLSEIFDELPKYYIIKTKVHAKDKEAMMKRAEEFLKGLEAKEYITIDGIKAVFDDGWILVRPSGTEPIIRIFVEFTREEKAKRMVDEILEILKKKG
ncbi:MAG: phosphoglucosamine mutase [Thermoplasmata archaeon]|nr:phosphoglucosamine mutase [Euryarchaeota archaeon]RLF65569.1 MAG: phosphoglucosamine mutase [Thermoplasmata archaeon]